MADKEKIRAFLQRVATEAAFRTQLEHQPVDTLAEMGFTVSESDVPPEGIKLPSNDAILANLDHLTDRCDTTGGEIFFII